MQSNKQSFYGLTLCDEKCGWLVNGKSSTTQENKPMNVKWLIDPEVFEKDAEPLLASLKKLGIEHTVCKFGTQYETYVDKFANEECPVMFYGCLQFGKFIKKNTNKITVYCNLPRFECLYYYPLFRQYLLNANYIMLPFGELARRKDWIFEHLGEVVFLRPSSGYKIFPGITVDKSSIEREIKHYSTHVNPHELVVIAPFVEIKNEWRIVVVNNKVITGGQYKKNGAIVRIKEVPDNIMNYANAIVANVKYTPDPAWTLDVCEINNGKLNVLEVGSFSCAGLYACDTDAIVQAINSNIMIVEV